MFLHISEVSFFVGVAASKTPFVFIDDLFITGEKLEGSLKNNCRPTFSNFFRIRENFKFQLHGLDLISVEK